jgi:hypothetical protein
MRNKDRYVQAPVRPGALPIIDYRTAPLAYRERMFIPLWATLLGQLLAGTGRV